MLSGHLAYLDLLPGLGGGEYAGVDDSSDGEGPSYDGTNLQEYQKKKSV